MPPEAQEVPMPRFQEQPQEVVEPEKEVQPAKRIRLPQSKKQGEKSLRIPGIKEKEPKRIGEESTRTYIEEKKVATELTVAAIGVISFIILGAQLVFRRRDGRKLREPNKLEYRAMAEPIGRIAARHIPTLETNLAKDIADGMKSLGAVKEYMLSNVWEARENLEGMNVVP